MYKMNERDIAIAEAAIEVFSRYGVQRTTMNDIAKAAGISRQTLYNAFANKDDILRATINLFADITIEAIRAGLETCSTLPEQLNLLFEHMVLKPYRLIHESPHAEDVIKGMNETSFAEIAACQERFRQEIEQVLMPFETQLTQDGISVKDFSDMARTAAMAAKYSAQDLAHLNRLLDGLKHMIVKTVGL